MPIISKILVAVLAALSIALVGYPQIVAAQASAADQDFSTVKEIQQVAVSGEGLYAPSLDSFRDGSLTFVIPTTNTREMSYTVTQDRAHYVVAKRESNGTVRIASDTSPAITCTGYTAKCLANVTTETELIAATPNWVTF